MDPHTISDPDTLALGQRLRTQDNRMTGHPIWLFQIKKPASGTDQTAHYWHTVTWALSEGGIAEFLAMHGHSYPDPPDSRIYVDSMHQSPEMVRLREFLLAAQPPAQLTGFVKSAPGLYYRTLGRFTATLKSAALHLGDDAATGYAWAVTDDMESSDPRFTLEPSLTDAYRRAVARLTAQHHSASRHTATP